jgi:hypothetical protein
VWKKRMFRCTSRSGRVPQKVLDVGAGSNSANTRGFITGSIVGMRKVISNFSVSKDGRQWRNA